MRRREQVGRVLGDRKLGALRETTNLRGQGMGQILYGSEISAGHVLEKGFMKGEEARCEGGGARKTAAPHRHEAVFELMREEMHRLDVALARGRQACVLHF